MKKKFNKFMCWITRVHLYQLVMPAEGRKVFGIQTYERITGDRVCSRCGKRQVITKGLQADGTVHSFWHDEESVLRIRKMFIP